MVQRKRFSSEFKKRVALSALKEDKTLNELGSMYEVNPVQISNWKKEAILHLDSAFNGLKAKKETGFSKEDLYSQIGQLKVELDWLKKKTGNCP